MSLSQLADAERYEQRVHLAAQALDTPVAPIGMLRRIAQARSRRVTGGLIVEGRERLPAARRVGLLASSMNPLTRAHVALADAAREAGRLDALCWVATTVTIDKERVERATLADRLVEAQLYAKATGDGLLLLKGGLYVDQARAAHQLLAPEAEMALIVGFDKIVQIFDPHYYSDRDAALRELFAEAELLVAPRQGYAEADLRALLARPENQPFAGRVRYCALPERYHADSSTEARALATAGRHDARLRELLAPEGLALARAAQPYAPMRLPGSHDLGDAYTARQMLLHALRDIPAASRGDAELSLARLVRWSAEDSARGEALRAWANSQGRHTLASLRAAIEMT